MVLGFLGYLLDGRLGTRPIFMIVFTILGAIGAGASVYYRYRHQIAELERQTIELRAAARGPLAGNRRVSNDGTASQPLEQRRG